MSICDKCRKEVPQSNSALAVQEEVCGFAGFVMDRHLYPTDDCEGSPSRVKLVESDPKWGEAYKKFQK